MSGLALLALVAWYAYRASKRADAHRALERRATQGATAYKLSGGAR